MASKRPSPLALGLIAAERWRVRVKETGTETNVVQFPSPEQPPAPVQSVTGDPPDKPLMPAKHGNSEPGIGKAKKRRARKRNAEKDGDKSWTAPQVSGSDVTE